MGIKYFFKWFKESFPRAVLQSDQFRVNENPNILLLDLNGMIHMSCQKVYRYGAFESKSLLRRSPPVFAGEKDDSVFYDVLRNISSLIEMVDPTEVVLCIDGVAPISKQIQQRQRRFMSKKTSGGFDSNCISPGTDFLYRLGNFLRTHLKINLEKNWLNVSNIYFMDSLVPGEGEHKLFDFLRTHKNRLQDVHFNVFIVGNDADLIMLSLLVSTLFLHETPIYILREDISSRNKYITLHINTFKQCILDLAPNKSSELVVCDFVILCFLVGNDFMPSIPLFNIYDGGLDMMLKYYFTNSDLVENEAPATSPNPDSATFTCEGKLRTAKRGSEGKAPMMLTYKTPQGAIIVNVRAMGPYFRHMLENICPLAIQHYKTRDYGFPNTLLDDIQCTLVEVDKVEVDKVEVDKVEVDKIEVDKIEVEIDDTGLQTQSGAGKAGTKHYLKAYSIHHKICKKQVKSYFREIEWVFNYYAYGGCTVDWSIYYPSQFAPTCLDLLEWIENAPSIEYSKIGVQRRTPIEPFFQLLCILPPHSSQLLPNPLDQVLLYDMHTFHPNEIKMNYEGKLNEWEGIPMLPALNYTILSQLYQKNVNLCSSHDSERNKIHNILKMSVSQ
jgi:5'-3' exonuclease